MTTSPSVGGAGASGDEAVWAVGAGRVLAGADADVPDLDHPEDRRPPR